MPSSSACKWSCARLDESDPRRDDLQERESALLAAHRDEWVADLPAWVRGKVSFRRGFAHRVECTATQFLKGGAALRRAAPIEEVRLDNQEGRLAALADSPLIEGLADLDLSHSYECSEEELTDFLGSPRLASVARAGILQQRPAALARGGHRALAAPGGADEARPGVERAGGGRRTALAGSAHLAGVTELDLHSNGLGDSGLSKLSDSPLFAGIERLCLGGERADLAGGGACSRKGPT